MPNAPVSAGVLFYRRTPQGHQVLLVHPGGPFWRRKQAGAWQLPKGLIEPGETPETAARRETEEELGVAVAAPLLALGPLRQRAGKQIHLFAAEQDIDVEAIRSANVTIEWPAHSGRMLTFPEVDAARWMDPDVAQAMILPSQAPFLDRLAALLRG